MSIPLASTYRALAFFLSLTASTTFAAGPVDPVEGEWTVTSAQWQMGGKHTYSFRNGTLLLATETFGGKDGNEPPRKHVQKWNYRIDNSVSPPLLVKTLVDPQGGVPYVESQTLQFDDQGTMWLNGRYTALSRIIPIVPQPTLRRVPIKTKSLGETHELVGPLGLPLGEMCSVAVTVQNDPYKGGGDFVLVSSVNGMRLPVPKRMWAEVFSHGNVKRLVPGEQLTLRAYQDGGMKGIPNQATAETRPIQTAGYGFQTWLVLVNVVEAGR